MGNFWLLTTYTKTLHDQTFCVTDTISTWSFEEMEEQEGGEGRGGERERGVRCAFRSCWLAVKLINHTHQMDKWHFSVIRLRATWVREKCLGGRRGEWCASWNQPGTLQDSWYSLTLIYSLTYPTQVSVENCVISLYVRFAPLNCENTQLLAKIGTKFRPNLSKQGVFFKQNLHKCFWERRGKERRDVSWDILTTHLWPAHITKTTPSTNHLLTHCLFAYPRYYSKSKSKKLNNFCNF